MIGALPMSDQRSLQVMLLKRAISLGGQVLETLVLIDSWGILRGFGSGDKAGQLLMELIFEDAKPKGGEAPPSRFDSRYFFPTIDEARRFLQEHRLGGVVHECGVLTGTPFVADMALTNPGFPYLTQAFEKAMIDTKERARRYWAAKTSMEWPEVLLVDNAVVRRTI
jgi:hypothetical protein